jgi:hypothetical protein
MRVRGVGIGVLALGVAAGCTVAAPSAVAPAPIASASPVATPSSAPPSSATAAPSSPAVAPAVAAAQAFLALDGARFEMRGDRWKPDVPLERQTEASGLVDPAADRGRLRIAFFPPEPGASPGPMTLTSDIVWDATDFWGALVDTDGEPSGWNRGTRERAREAAILGRVAEEPLALIRFVAAATDTEVEPLPDAPLGDAVARRWRVAVPLDDAQAAYVPPDTYLAVGQIFAIDAFPVEVWVVDERIARIGYVLERDQAPYGGPDRFETWYDWSGHGEPIELEIPPPGEVVELPE